jgi:hypothetical protein
MSQPVRRNVIALVALTATLAFTPALAANRVVTIVNETSVTMTKFYASNVGTKNWEENILDGDRLQPGESIDIDIDDGTKACRYDFRAVFKDGESVEKGNVNVCEVGEFSFTE